MSTTFNSPCHGSTSLYACLFDMALFGKKKPTVNQVDLPRFFAAVDINISSFDRFSAERQTINGVETDIMFLEGKPGLPLIYFVHGLGASFRFFYEGILFFHSLGYSVLAHSRSGELQPLTGELSLESLLAEVETVLAPHKKKKIHIISSSFGGIISLLTAERLGSQIKTVTTIGSFLKFEWNLAHDILYDVMRSVQLERVPARDLGPFAPQIRFIRGRSQAVMNYVLTEYETFPQKSLVRYLEILKALNYASSAPVVEAELLFLHGRDDDMVPLSCYEQLKRAYPRARAILLDNCGHGPFLSQPEAVYSSVLELMKKSGEPI